jgi:hypothetical protein
VLAVLRKYTEKMPCLADTGYVGAGHGVVTPVKRGPSKLTGGALPRGYCACCHCWR